MSLFPCLIGGGDIEMSPNKIAGSTTSSYTASFSASGTNGANDCHALIVALTGGNFDVTAITDISLTINGNIVSTADAYSDPVTVSSSGYGSLAVVIIPAEIPAGATVSISFTATGGYSSGTYGVYAV